MSVYSTLDDYAAAIVYPALESADGVTITHDQALEIARAMTIWHDEYTPGGQINVTRSGYIENTAADFWGTVATVLEG